MPCPAQVTRGTTWAMLDNPVFATATEHQYGYHGSQSVSPQESRRSVRESPPRPTELATGWRQVIPKLSWPEEPLTRTLHGGGEARPNESV